MCSRTLEEYRLRHIQIENRLGEYREIRVGRVDVKRFECRGCSEVIPLYTFMDLHLLCVQCTVISTYELRDLPIQQGTRRISLKRCTYFNEVDCARTVNYMYS